MDNNIFTDKQISYMYSNPDFFRFINNYFSTFSINYQELGLEINQNDFMDEDMNIYIRIVLANITELRQMLSEIEKTLSYSYVDSIKTFDGQIHGHLQVQRYLQTTSQIKYPKEYPCRVKTRTSITPENEFLIYIIEYVIKMLQEFDKFLNNYTGSILSTEKQLVDEYIRTFRAFTKKNYFRECACELREIRKQFGDIFPNTLLNEIRMRGIKGKIRNYRSYEKIFQWYWTYRKGSVVLNKEKTIKLIRYSDEFCNRLFELWCLYSIKETFINEFGMTLVSERNIMKLGNNSVFTLCTATGGIVDIFYQKGASLYWNEDIEPMWKYVNNDGKKKGLIGIPDISVRYKAELDTLVMIDLKNRVRCAGNNAEEIYKILGYYTNFEKMLEHTYSREVKKQAILIFRNDNCGFDEVLISDDNYLLNTYSVSPSEKEELNCNQFKRICQCILDTQGIDGKTSEVLGNYKNERELLTANKNQFADDEMYCLSERNHIVISNLFATGDLAEELPKQKELLRQNYFPHIWDRMSPKAQEILAMADCLFMGMKEYEGADYAPVCLEYCRGLEVQINQLIFEPFKSSHNIVALTRTNRFYEKMKEPREMTLGECVYALDKCTHRSYPMVELKNYIDSVVKDSITFFGEAVPAMRDINTNIRRLSAHTTIMRYGELISTRQQILGIGYLNLFYQMLDHR